MKYLIGQEGKIVSFTIIRTPPTGFHFQAPYAVALVVVNGKKTVICQVVDCDYEKLKIGLKVKVVVRKIIEPDDSGIIPYGLKVVLV